jgi:hypothetical protein
MAGFGRISFQIAYAILQRWCQEEILRIIILAGSSLCVRHQRLLLLLALLAFLLLAVSAMTLFPNVACCWFAPACSMLEGMTDNRVLQTPKISRETVGTEQQQQQPQPQPLNSENSEL